MLCLQTASCSERKCKGLTCLGKHAGLLPNDCPTAPPAHNTCWSPAGRKAAAHTPVELQCLDLARKVECVHGVGLCSCAKCSLSACRGQKDDSRPGNSELIGDGAVVRIIPGRLSSAFLHDTSWFELLAISPLCSLLLGASCFYTNWAVPVEPNLYITCLLSFSISCIFLALGE